MGVDVNGCGWGKDRHPAHQGHVHYRMGLFACGRPLWVWMSMGVGGWRTVILLTKVIYIITCVCLLVLPYECGCE